MGRVSPLNTVIVHGDWASFLGSTAVGIPSANATFTPVKARASVKTKLRIVISLAGDVSGTTLCAPLPTGQVAVRTGNGNFCELVRRAHETPRHEIALLEH